MTLIWRFLGVEMSILRGERLAIDAGKVRLFSKHVAVGIYN